MPQLKYWKFVSIESIRSFGGSMVLTVLAAYLSSLGYADGSISIIFGLFPFTMFLTSILSGELGDKVGRSWLIRGFLLLMAGSYILYFIGSPTPVILGRILDGVSFAGLSVLVISKIEDLLSDTTRGFYTGVFYSFRDGARILSPVVAGYLADKWVGFPFLTAAVILVITSFFLHNSSFHKKKEVSFHPIKDFTWFVKNRKLLPMVILGPLMNGLLPVVNVFMPLLVVKELGLGYLAVGAASSAYMAGHAFQFAFGKLGDKLGTGSDVRDCNNVPLHPARAGNSNFLCQAFDNVLHLRNKHGGLERVLHGMAFLHRRAGK